MNKTANILLGFYHFDAFDLGSYKKLKLIFRITAFTVFFSLIYLHLSYFFPWLVEMINKEVTLTAVPLMAILMIISFFIILMLF